MFSITLLVLIIIYEIFRLVKFDEFKAVISILESMKGKERGSEEMANAVNLFFDNKRYFGYILYEIAYVLILAILFFTQYWLIALLITAQGLILHRIIKNNTRRFLYIDTSITLAIIIVGLIFI